ncbi:MAG: DNA-processing protein DprA [Endomicrobiales bacterium]|jgi:DNA processing protein
MDSQQKAILTLHLIAEMSPERMQCLIRRFGSAVEVLAAPLSELRTVSEISEELAARIARAACDVDVDGEITAAQKAGAQIVTYTDQSYPDSLKNLKDFPSVLYVRGTFEAYDTAGVAIVGTRHPTEYGRTVAAQFAAACARSEITTVSGLTRGIDMEVHQSCLAEGGRTIAVLGCGFDHDYPAESTRLEEKIVSCGVLVTEFPMGAVAGRNHFPLCNRIISGLSSATVVVEAGTKSSSLVTARCAADQGRIVFAVPGPISSEYSKGPHFLLKSGARLAQSPDDIIRHVQQPGDLFPLPTTMNTLEALAESSDTDEQRLRGIIAATVNDESGDSFKCP